MSRSYKTRKLIVKRQYQMLAAILLILAGGLLLIPKYTTSEGINPESFVKKVVSSERYVSTDQLAERLIDQDPTVLLVDVRPEADYNKFTLPNAINIPLEKILDEDYESYMNQDAYDVILFSNDNFYANQAWMIGNRLNYPNLYVLKGGINEWFNTIINPKYPDESMPRTAFELYNFRKAAGMYFGVGAPSAKDNASAKPAKKVITVKKKKKRVPEGGC